jgi:hypothetical protein
VTSTALYRISLSAAVSFILAGVASASCLPPPAVLKPGPGQVYGCPVYSHTANGKLWFSNFVETADNNLYGFFTDVQFDEIGNVTGGGLDVNGQAPMRGRSDQANQINAIVTQNWALIQWSNAFQTDMALIGVTFTLSGGQFDTPDGAQGTHQPALIITGGIKQGF